MPLPDCAGGGAELADSRVAARPAPARLRGQISLGSLTSALVLAGLIGGLGYGGHALLQDLQRVGFAPLTLAPEVVATAPLLRAPAMDWMWAPDPGLSAYEWDDLQLAAAPAGLPARDGPISAIDPETSGVFAPRNAAAAAISPAQTSGVLVPDGPSGGMRITLSPDEAALAEPVLATARATAPPNVVLHATDETWIRVRDGEAVIFEGILPPGGQYEVPGREGAAPAHGQRGGFVRTGRRRLLRTDRQLERGAEEHVAARPGHFRPSAGGDSLGDPPQVRR